MELLFTKHAILRMRERGITETEIYEVFENPLLVLEKSGKVVIGRTRQRRHLTLVMDSSGCRLLTLWPSNRAQRKLYKAKIRE